MTTELEQFHRWQKDAGNFHATEPVERWWRMSETAKQELYKKWAAEDAGIPCQNTTTKKPN